MHKSVIVICATGLLLIGFMAGSRYAHQPARSTTPWLSSGTAKEPVPFDYEAPVPKITIGEAQNHREDHYQALASVDDVLELPTDFAQTEALYILAGRANAAELEELILQSTRIIQRHDRYAALDILFARYAELDPYAAVAFLLALELDIDDQIIGSIYGRWALVDLHSAIASANQVGNIALRRKAGYAILTTMSRSSSVPLDTIESQLADRHNITHLEGGAVGARANHDPETALFQALALDGRHARFDAIWRVGMVWARNDPHQALANAENIPDLQLRERYLRAVYQQWVADDPDGAIQSVLAIDDQQRRNSQLETMLQSYAQTNPQGAMSLVTQLNGNARDQAYANIFRSWVAQDPDAAMQALSTLNAGEAGNRNLTSTLAQYLASADPERAMQWADTLGMQERERVLPTIINHMSNTDPQRAISAVLNIESQQLRESMLTNVIQVLAHTNPQLALQYMTELPDGSMRDSMYQSIASRWAATDTQAAMAWASTLSGQAYVQAMTGLAPSIALNDPQQAAALVMQMPSAQRSNLLRSIAGTIGARDPQEAMAWLGQFNNDPAYDDAVVGVLHRLAIQNPLQALNIANQLSGTQRQSAVQNALGVWAQMNPAAAARWAAGSDQAVRTQAISSVMTRWSHAAPAAAWQWARTLRTGADKDAALMTLISNSTFSVGDLQAMIGEIASDTARDQAIMAAYLRVWHESKDVQAMENLLDRVDASDELRRRVRAYAAE